MLERTSKLLIGKDINRDAQVVAGAVITTTIASTGLADGEIVVLDKTFKVLAEGASYADSDIIYICQGTGDTYTYVTESGSTVTGVRKLLFSDPIDGGLIKNYTGRAYSAPSQQSTAVSINGKTPAAGTEYVLHIVYNDINEHPGQFTHTYRVVASGTDLDVLGAAFVTKISRHSGARITASYDTGTDIITLTGKAIPSCTTSLKDIDKFTMVEFVANLNYIDTDGIYQSFETSVTDTPASYGSGSWYEVRDIEKLYSSDRGPRNRTLFPVIAPDFRVVVGATYHIINIEHERAYVSPDNQYVKYAPLTTTLAFVVPSSGTQLTSVLAQLNSWMASTPKALQHITF